MATNAAPLSGQAQRFAAAALVVVLVAVSVWLFGRPEPPEPSVQVVATAEDWTARREPGGFVTVEVPETAAELFVTPAELAGRVPAVLVPAGDGPVRSVAGRPRRRLGGRPVGRSAGSGGGPVAVARSGARGRRGRGARR